MAFENFRDTQAEWDKTESAKNFFEQLNAQKDKPSFLQNVSILLIATEDDTESRTLQQGKGTVKTSKKR